MPLKFYGISVPISIVLASVYFYYITHREPPHKSNNNPSRQFKDLDVVVHHRPSECRRKAGRGDLVHVHYTGYLKSSGKQFQTTREQSEPYVFKLGTCSRKQKPECMKGFENGISGMCPGEKRKVTIPPSLAWAKEARPEGVAADDSVVFHVELVDID